MNRNGFMHGCVLNMAKVFLSALPMEIKGSDGEISADRRQFVECGVASSGAFVLASTINDAVQRGSRCTAAKSRMVDLDNHC